MKKPIYIFSDSRLLRSENSLLAERIIKNESEENDEVLDIDSEEFLIGEEVELPQGEKQRIPVESVDSIFTFGTVRFNTRFLSFCSKHGIPVHILTYNQKYSGSFFPQRIYQSGNMIIKQVEHYIDSNKRLEIAKEFVFGAIHGALANLKYYNNRRGGFIEDINTLEEMLLLVNEANDIPQLMGIEGTAKRNYYYAWQNIFTQPVNFNNRVKNPPNNLINALISYGNMLMYAVTATEIFRTRIYPDIGYLHSAGENRLPLSFDIAEIFKPIIIDRAIFTVINKNMISENDVSYRKNMCLIKKSARKTFVTEIHEKLHTIISPEKNAGRGMSYRRLIREECYKIMKHLNNEEKYKSFRIRW